MSLRSPIPTRLLRPLFLWAIACGTVLITWGSLRYFFGDEEHPFVLEKIATAHLASEATWIAALHVHVIAAAFALPACLVLSLRSVQRRVPRVHRWLGRITGVVVLLALVPSGGYLALWAKGGAASTVGFLVSGGIVAVAMVQGIRTARARDYVAHRRCTAHVLAQLSVAVTSRALLLVFDCAAIDPELAYLAALGIPVVGSALVAQWSSEPVRRRTSQEKNHETVPRLFVRDPAR
jgi:hypothetical protein